MRVKRGIRRKKLSLKIRYKIYKVAIIIHNNFIIYYHKSCYFAIGRIKLFMRKIGIEN